MKIAIAKTYLPGAGSYRSLAMSHNVSETQVTEWVKKYRIHGEMAFSEHQGNARYSSEFKKQCVEAVLQGEGSVDDLVTRYNISSRSLLRGWIKLYNANIGLKDYDLKREVYMAQTGRKTTLEERKEIGYVTNAMAQWK